MNRVKAPSKLLETKSLVQSKTLIVCLSPEFRDLASKIFEEAVSVMRLKSS